jgi:hypothetical protein
MKRVMLLLVLCLCFFGLCGEYSFSQAKMTNEERIKLCHWVVRDHLKGLQPYEEYICDGKLTNIKISDNIKIKSSIWVRKGNNEPIDYGIRSYLEYNF